MSINQPLTCPEVKKEKTVDEEKTEAELALMMAEDDGHKHFNRLALAKREREEEKVCCIAICNIHKDSSDPLGCSGTEKGQEEEEC